MARRPAKGDWWELLDLDGSTTALDIDDPWDVYRALRPERARRPTAKDVLALICELDDGLTPFAARRTRHGWHARGPEGTVAPMHTNNIFEANGVLSLLRQRVIHIDEHGRFIFPESQLNPYRRYRSRFLRGSPPLPAEIITVR
jgi:hypothetical protein